MLASKQLISSFSLFCLFHILRDLNYLNPTFSAELCPPRLLTLIYNIKYKYKIHCKIQIKLYKQYNLKSIKPQMPPPPCRRHSKAN